MPTLHDVDIRQLTALIAVVDEGTFAKAARRVGFTQSAVSQQIASLEKSAGLAVFDRPKGPRPVELTPAGRMLLEYARSTVERAEDMDKRLDRLRRGISGQLTVGSFQSVSSKLLPQIIGRMRTEVPDVDVRLTEADDQERLLANVLADELDLAFTIDLVDDPSLIVEVLGHDPFVVVAPRDEASGDSIALGDLNGQQLIGQPSSDSCQVMIDERMMAAGLKPDYAFRFSDNAAVQSMVRSGMGWAVMPALAVDHNDPGVTVLIPDPPVTPRSLQLIRRADHTLPPAAHTFIRITHEVAGPLLDSSALPAAG